MRTLDLEHVVVYAVDDRVEVPPELVLSGGFEDGARGRILALAREAEAWGSGARSLTCIVDADRACLEQADAQFATLLKTDLASFDAQAFASSAFQRFLDVVIRMEANAQELVVELLPTLNELFLVRHVLHTMSPPVPLIEKFVACCDFRRSPVVDVKELLRRSLAVAGQLDQMDAALERLEAAHQLLPDERLRAVRGHDVAPVLIRRLGLKNRWADADAVQDTLLALAVDAPDVRESQVLRDLSRRLS